MKGFIALVMGLWCSIQFLNAQQMVISGRITDSYTGEALQSAHVYAKQEKKAAVSDADGRFSLTLPVAEKMVLTVSYVGYTTREITLEHQQDTTLNIGLKPDNQLPDVRIYAPRIDFGVRNAQMSAVELPVAQIKAMPALFGETDVMKVVQKLPGVQSINDGNAGIFVRGGGYDQNLITLDGSTLYNSEHLNGFVSALNADMIENVILYKGAFPARYGSRLSSVLDIGMREGSNEKFSGLVSIGMLSSRLQAEGPIRRGVSSFNIGVRFSYFDAFVYPLLDAIYDKPKALKPYSRMNYYDINAKIVHRFSDRDKLSAVFYMGKDKVNTSPTESHQQYMAIDKNAEGEQAIGYDNAKNNDTENRWGNIVSSLFWTHQIDSDYSINTNLSYSQYRYLLKMTSEVHNKQDLLTNSENSLLSQYDEESYSGYYSGINDIALTADLYRKWKENHQLRWGAKLSWQQVSPIVDIYKESFSKILLTGTYIEQKQHVDTVLGKREQLITATAYIEDDYTLNERIKMNAGLRYSLYAVKGKMHQSLEPRLSLRYLLNEDMAVKLSYSRMSQGLHLLSSSNLVMPSDIWVSTNKEVPLMKADQWALGYNYNLKEGWELSVEGYYKLMDNVMDYREGASYMSASGDWQKLIALGKGKSYGVEWLLQKKSGKSTGWISYTWAKSRRKYDRPGQEINGGEEFYANNDRRHNFNIVYTHRFNDRLDISAAWTYQSGRRGIISTTAIYGGRVDEYDPFGIFTSSFGGYLGDGGSNTPDSPIYFRRFSRFYTYTERNGFKLPNTHHLDISINLTTQHSTCKSIISLAIYNLYNQQNISNVYIGYDNNKTVLKGICVLPFMPSLNFKLNF